MDYPLLRVNQLYYMKTTQHALHKSKEDLLKEIELSIFHQSSSILMNFRIVVKSTVQQIRSSDNLADLFIKALPTTTFKKLVHQIGMRQLKDLQNEI